MIIIGHTRGMIYYASSVNLLDKDTIIEIDNGLFLSGVVHFTLFNNRLQPVAERLHFVNHGDYINFAIQNKFVTDSINLIIQPLNLIEENRTFSGSVSLLLNNSDQFNYLKTNIISELLITSDLPGIIENPAYYIQPANKLVKKHTDLLMLTHGWRRFLWDDVIKGNIQKIKFDVEHGITVEGRITREILEFPIKNASVRLFILDKYNDVFLTYSNKKGSFSFEKLYYYDTLDVKIVGRKSNGGKNLLIHLEETPPDQISEYHGDIFLTTTSKLNKKVYRKLQNELAREEMLQREKELDSIFSTSIYGRPDYVLWSDDIPSGYSNLLDAMQGRIPGVRIVGDNVTIRGVSTILGSTEPLLVLDGVPTAFQTIKSIPVEDVDRIEVLKGPSAAIYGSRGANGVIAVYTKRGSFMKKGEISFSMLGYHLTERFYSPTETSLNNRIQKNQLPVTIYWNPDLVLHNGITIITVPVKETNLIKTIVIEGTDQNGKLGYAFLTLE
ncbi:Vitamin B12 transporter BtuB [subsurface metagenome]